MGTFESMKMFVETKKMGTTFEEELAMIHAYHEPHVAGDASSKGSIELTAWDYAGLTRRTSVVRCNPLCVIFDVSQKQGILKTLQQ